MHAPESATTALLLIDVINDLDFEGADALLEQANPMSQRLAALKERARASHIPIIYVNDNFGRWRSDCRAIVEHCTGAASLGRPIVERLKPTADDYFVLKPQNSGFYETTLQLLLRHLGVQTVVLTGIAADNCVLFTANDAYLRGYRIVVPADCLASESRALLDSSLEHMKRLLKAEILDSAAVDFHAAAPKRPS